MHNTLISGDFIIMELKYHAYIKETLLSLFSDQFSRCPAADAIPGTEADRWIFRCFESFAET